MANIVKRLFVALSVVLLPTISNSQVESVGNWSFVNDNSACGLLSYKFPDVSKMDANELYSYAEQVKLNGGFSDSTVIEIGLDKSSRGTSASLFSTLLNESAGAKSVILIFDQGSKSVSLQGQTPRRKADTMIAQLSQRNYVNLEMTSFFQVAVPLFMKHGSVSIIVNGKKISNVSLKGFSAAFKKFQSC